MALGDGLHSNSSHVHRVHEYEYADTTAMNAATGFTSDDLGKWAKITGTGEFYELTATTPTWTQRIGTSGSIHNPVTLAADADTILGLSTQQLTLDTQAANRVFAGPTSGGAADPTFRALVAADLPAGVGFPFNVKTVDLTDPNADYSTLSAALAAVSAGTVLLLGPGDYVAESLLVPDGVSIIGQGMDVTTISTSTAGTAELFRFTSPTLTSVFSNLTMSISKSGAGATVSAIYITAGTGQLELINCSIFVDNNASGGSGYIIRGTTNLIINGGNYSADGTGVGVGSLVSGTASMSNLSGLPVFFFDVLGTVSGDDGLYFDGNDGSIKSLLSHMKVQVDDSGVGGSTALTLRHNTSGTPAAGTGVEIAAETESSTTENTPIGALAWLYAVVTHASRRTIAVIYGYYIATKIELAVFSAPDVASSAGNARGKGAVDLQNYRSAGTQVASGSFSNILGGQLSTVSGDASSIVNGISGVISGLRSFIANGSQNEISSDGSSILGGDDNLAAAIYSSVLPGRYARTRHRTQVVHAGNRFAATGDAQATLGIHLLRSVTHSDANWYTLYPDGTGTYLLEIPADTVWVFSCFVVGTTQGCTKSFAFKLEGIIENDGGTTTLLAGGASTVIYDTDDTSFDARANANDGLDALEIQVSDSDSGGNVVRWSARLEMAEVTFPA